MVCFLRKKSFLNFNKKLILTIDGKKYTLLNGEAVSLELELGVHRFMIEINHQIKAYYFELKSLDNYKIDIENYLFLSAKSKGLKLTKF